MAYRLDITCSNCGERESVPNLLSAIDAVSDRWGSCGNALYCPECTRTWFERNQKPMGGKQNTFTVIAAMFFANYDAKKKGRKQ